MDYYIERSAGQPEGPYSLDQLKEMYSRGELSAASYVAAAGDADWRTFSDLIRSAEPVAAAAAPPPLRPPTVAPTPPPAPVSNLNHPLVVEGKMVSGTAGKTCAQLVEEVKHGGRFVVYQYVFSIVILSFRRNAGITYLPPGSSGAGKALGWSLLSCGVGLWGIPWGFIYTLGAVWRNTAGGVDVTEPVLAGLVGPAEANAIVQRRPRLATGALWAVRLGIFLSPILLFLLMASFGAIENARLNKIPGYKNYERADDQLRGSAAQSGGNTPEAQKEARDLASNMEMMLELAISKSGKQPKDRHFVVWCENHEGHCLFLVKVPELKRYDQGSKGLIAATSWAMARQASARLKHKPGDKLAVALRGDLVYDQLLEGPYTPRGNEEDPTTLSDDVKVRRGGSLKQNFAPYFVE